MSEIAGSSSDSSSDDAAATAPSDEDEGLVAPENVTRYVVQLEDAPVAEAEPHKLKGEAVAVTADEQGVAAALVAMLAEHGTTARIVEDTASVVDSDVVVDLGALARSGEPVKAVFGRVRQAIDGTPSRIVAVSALGGQFGHAAVVDEGRGGVSGLIKSLRKEFPALSARVVDVHPGDDAGQIAGRILDEMQTDDTHAEVGYVDGRRVRPSVVEQPSEPVEKNRLDKDSVVLITGGARGITARIAVAMAERYGCRLELAGRSPAPEGDEDEETVGAVDALALRAVLAKSGALSGPREIEAAVGRILAARQIRATFAAVRATGAELVYHSVDVRDAEAFGAVIDDIYERHGRLDGVVHGAGVLEDKLLQQKTSESFARVYDTKVAGARVLAAKLREGLDFLAFFGSVAGVFGNRGQADYAAANDALDKLALSLNGRLGRRVFSIDWGPWAGTGMVTPELEREYARRGIGLIPVDQGVAAFLDELQHNDDKVAQVILMRATPESLA